MLCANALILFELDEGFVAKFQAKCAIVIQGLISKFHTRLSKMLGAEKTSAVLGFAHFCQNKEIVRFGFKARSSLYSKHLKIT